MITLSGLARRLAGLGTAICLGLLWFGAAAKAESGAQLPPVVQDGFATWAKQGASYAFDVWKKGGLLEGDNKPGVLAGYFRRLDRLVGNYRSFELIENKRIGASAQIIYLSLNFEHAAVYGRFLMYRGEKEWVVQDMDFSLKPELIMPWLVFAGVNYAE